MFDSASSAALIGTEVISSSRCKTGLRELRKGARAVRQAAAQGRQAMLLVARHLAERAGVAFGQENRIIAEAGGSAWRPHQRAVDAALEFLHMPVRPGHAQRAHEMRLALVGTHGGA